MLTLLAIETSPSSTPSRRAAVPRAPSKQAAKPTANNSSGFGAATLPAQRGRQAKLQVELSVTGLRVPLRSAAGDGGPGCVNRVVAHPVHPDLILVRADVAEVPARTVAW